MKILILLKPLEEGGVRRVVENIKVILEKKGHKVKIISREGDLKIYSFIESIFPLRKRVQELMKEDYDIIYTHDWSIAFPLLFPLQIFRKKHYCCFHGIQIGKTNIFQKIVGKRMGKKLLVVSDTFHKRFPKAEVVYNGADKNEFYDMKKERKYVGYMDVGNTVVDETINKANELSKKFKLDISIAKGIPFDKMNEWYNSLKFFVSLPPKQAGFMLCWLEAKLAGVPNIIGNDYGIGINTIHKKWKEMTWEKHVEKLLGIFK